MNHDEDNVWPWASGLYKRPALLQGRDLKVHLKEQQMHSICGGGGVGGREGVLLMFGWALVLHMR